MKKLSNRYEMSKKSSIEKPSGGGGVGISTSVRRFWREHFKSVPGMLGANDAVNYLIALDYANAKPIHRFLLKSGEVGEIRKSNSFYYIAAIRQDKRHDVIVIQKAIKEPPEDVRKRRMSDEWINQPRNKGQ